MSEMTARITKKLLIALHSEGCAASLAENGMIIVPPHLYMQARTIALEVIAAMREPTEAMRGEWDDYVIEAYQAMIDKALEE